MNTTRRRILIGLAAFPFTLRAAEEPESSAGDGGRLLGSWLVTAGQLSMIFSLEPNGEALVIFDEKGALTIGRHGWRPAPGGAIIDTIPRFRMWRSLGPCAVRVEMEVLPADLGVSTVLKEFPHRFCMKRVSHSPIPKELLRRPLPKGWEAETVEDLWDKVEAPRR